MREAVPLPYVGHEGWEERAACRGADVELFFGPSHFESKAERLAREAAAKTICTGCPVLQPCREAAILRDELFGVWGGLAESDRRIVQARRAG